MVLRYWGAAGIAAEDFAPLVDPAKGGIETSTLARAVRDRGYRALPASGTPALVQGELANGRPVIALIEDRPGAFHYVVVVGWHARTVVLHDPARTPYVLAQPEVFARQWRSSGHWMLAIAPPHQRSRNPDVSAAPRSDLVSVPRSSSCDALVADGVRLAQRNDLSQAERVLTDAAYRCNGAAPFRELAGVRLLQRRWPEVRDLAARALEIDAADAHAWRLLASARYIGGDPPGALDAWNRAGEPRVDAVNVSGLQRITHRAVERLLGIDVGTVLTRAGTERARRRLEELPAALMTRLEYVPRPAGAADVRAHVVERRVVPRGRLTWTAIGLRAAATREVSLGLASLGGGGERLDVSWRFWPHRPAVAAALHVPGRFGLISLELFSERQPFTDPALGSAHRLATQTKLADWATGALRWEIRGGFSRWRGSGAFGTLGGSARFERGRGHIAAGLDTWLGDTKFAASALDAGWRSSRLRRGFVFNLIGALQTIDTAAPLDLWPAGDTGHARRSLLRAHPVLNDGRLRVERLGRHLAHATVEARRWWRPLGTVPVGAAVFADAGRTAGRRVGAAVSDVDIGTGFRLALPGRAGSFRVDLARGLSDGRNAFSVVWDPEP